MLDGIKLQNIFQTLGEVNRLRIIRFVGDKTRSVSEIVEVLKLSQPLVSHHLRVLREQGILKTKREGPFVYYELSDLRILDALGIFSEILIVPYRRSKTTESMFACGELFMKFMNKK